MACQRTQSGCFSLHAEWPGGPVCWRHSHALPCTKGSTPLPPVTCLARENPPSSGVPMTLPALKVKVPHPKNPLILWEIWGVGHPMLSNPYSHLSSGSDDVLSSHQPHRSSFLFLVPMHSLPGPCSCYSPSPCLHGYLV